MVASSDKPLVEHKIDMKASIPKKGVTAGELKSAGNDFVVNEFSAMIDESLDDISHTSLYIAQNRNLLVLHSFHL